MRIEYDKETDSMYIEFSSGPAVITVEINSFINVDLDASNELVGIDVHSHASHLNLSELELSNMPQMKNIRFV